jgi:hypothetical protein
MEGGIFLIVQFSFPRPFKPEYGVKAKALHQVLSGQNWIEEVFAASGGVGAGPSSIWVFKLENYAALDRLLKGSEPTAKAYVDFFSLMDDVQDFIRDEVGFT